MSITDYFGDVIGQESSVARIATAIGRHWGDGPMVEDIDGVPTEWWRFLAVRADFFATVRSYAEATLEQAFPHLSEHTVEIWEQIKGVPPAPPGTLKWARLQRLLAYCQARLGARPADIVDALSALAGAEVLEIIEKKATDCVNAPARIFEFWTLVDADTADDEDLRGDINTIVDRWKPGHTHHGSSEGPAAPGEYGGVRVGTESGPTWFKTGSGDEKTGRNLIQYSP